MGRVCTKVGDEVHLLSENAQRILRFPYRPADDAFIFYRLTPDGEVAGENEIRKPLAAIHLVVVEADRTAAIAALPQREAAGGEALLDRTLTECVEFRGEFRLRNGGALRPAGVRESRDVFFSERVEPCLLLVDRIVFLVGAGYCLYGLHP